MLLEEKGLKVWEKYKGHPYSEFRILTDREEPWRNLFYSNEQFLVES